MENKINIAELLKDCPKGLELDCTLFDDVKFETVANNSIYIRLNNGELFALSPYGNCIEFAISKCVIFPKGETTWEGVVLPCKFKEGDVVVNASNEDSNAFIYAGENNNYYECYIGLTTGTIPELSTDKSLAWVSKKSGIRFANEEEKEKLFQAIEDNGYKWNAETKTLEKLIQPKFKVGDKVVLVSEPEEQYIITGIDQRPDGVYYEATGVNTNSTLSKYSEYKLLLYNGDTREEYIKALATFGPSHQRMMCMEECAELIDVLAKYDRGRADAKDVITELADVSIMVEQMTMLFGKEEFEKEKEWKLKRLLERINEES